MRGERCRFNHHKVGKHEEQEEKMMDGWSRGIDVEEQGTKEERSKGEVKLGRGIKAMN